MKQYKTNATYKNTGEQECRFEEIACGSFFVCNLELEGTYSIFQKLDSYSAVFSNEHEEHFNAVAISAGGVLVAMAGDDIVTPIVNMNIHYEL